MPARPTPGPLTIRVAGNGSGDLGIIAPGQIDADVQAEDLGGLLIAECYADIRRPGEGAREEALANARLFVLAGRMAAMLELLFDRDCRIYAHELTIPMLTHRDAVKVLIEARALLHELREGA